MLHVPNILLCIASSGNIPTLSHTAEDSKCATHLVLGLYFRLEKVHIKKKKNNLLQQENISYCHMEIAPPAAVPAVGYNLCQSRTTNSLNSTSSVLEMSHL